MPGHDVHQVRAHRLGLLGAGVAMIVIGWGTTTPVLGGLGLLVYPAVRVGGGAPDIDSESSIPFRWLTHVVKVGTTIVLAYLVSRHAELLLQAFTAVATLVDTPMWGILALATLVVVAVIDFITQDILIAILPPHRGLLHEFLVWGYLVAGGVAVLLHTGVPVIPHHILVISIGTVGGGFLLGVGGHLAQDDKL